MEEQKKSRIFKILGVLVGIIFVFEGFSERADFRRIKIVGKPAVVDPIRSYSSTKSGYSATFSFTTEEGQKITRRHSFPSELVDDFKAGKPVTVLYNPGQPAEFIFEKDSSPWAMILGGLGMALAALLFA